MKCLSSWWRSLKKTTLKLWSAPGKSCPSLESNSDLDLSQCCSSVYAVTSGFISLWATLWLCLRNHSTDLIHSGLGFVTMSHSSPLTVFVFDWFICYCGRFYPKEFCDLWGPTKHLFWRFLDSRHGRLWELNFTDKHRQTCGPHLILVMKVWTEQFGFFYIRPRTLSSGAFQKDLSLKGHVLEVRWCHCALTLGWIKLNVNNEGNKRADTVEGASNV